MNTWILINQHHKEQELVLTPAERASRRMRFAGRRFPQILTSGELCKYHGKMLSVCGLKCVSQDEDQVDPINSQFNVLYVLYTGGSYLN